MDNIDKASQLEEAQRKAAINKAKEQAPVCDIEVEECILCGEKIPPARRLAIKGCKRCIDCQRAMESKC